MMAFAGFRIVADSVPALPSTVLSFADVPFPVRSSFWHKIALLCNGNNTVKAEKKLWEVHTIIRKLSILNRRLSLFMA